VVTTFLVMTALGAASVLLGLRGFQGRVKRMPSDTALNNHSAHVLLGGALFLMGLLGLVPAPDLARALILVPLLVLLALGLYSHFIRPPRWTQPRWQQQLDDEVRSSRKLARDARRARR
jgi:hypothetical protein